MLIFDQVLVDGLFRGLEVVFSYPVIFFVIGGALIGMLFGAIPGLGGIIAISLLIPLTFGLDGTVALSLFAAVLGGVAFGGSISAILINTPGGAGNAATLIDGYPMARQGRGLEALSISAVASAGGALFGLLLLILLLPIAREMILMFTPPEFFWLAILGLSVIAVIAKGQTLKGLIGGGLGMMFAFIGYDNVSGVYRYGFGTEYLWDGIQLVPAIIGIFALSEVMHLMTKGGTIASDSNPGAEIKQDYNQILDGIRFVISRPSLFIRSSVIGVLIGMIPGAGGSVATFLSYMQALQTSNDPDSFGKGNPEGVLAAEAANDAKDGGALLPTVVFGIPGSAVMAVILGAMMLHGLAPGRRLLEQDANVLFAIIISLIIANLLTSTLGLLGAKYFAKLTTIRIDILVPAIIVISLAGCYAIRFSFGDVIIAVIFGFIGYVFLIYGYSRIALILAIILGPIAERAFHQSLMISDVGYWIFIIRPLSIILILLLLLNLIAPPYIARRRAIKKGEIE